jgi:formate dehydrogenase subunit gamma
MHPRQILHVLAIHVFAIITILAVAAVPVPAGAQQPVNPTASVVTEEQLLQQLHQIQGRGSIPDVKSYVIEQPAGREWRLFHEVLLPWIGGVVILGIIALLAIFYFWRGTVRIEEGRSGRTILRFNSFDRFAHWLVVVSFVVLALTGLNITFGKRLLLPLLGPETFSNFAMAAKYAHDYASFPFVVGVVMLFLAWVKDNLPAAGDLEWLKKGGGFVGHEHPPAWKFNAGQKMLFWFVNLATIAVAISGYLLMFPFYVTDIFGMQVAQFAHGFVAMFFVALVIAHIYIGTLGMEGGFDAMANGEVDVNWAKQHHKLWVDKELARGRAASPPAGASAEPAE